jgi:hypothetical protein
VAVGKKWYSFFVVTDEPGEAAGQRTQPGVPGGGAPAVAPPPRRVADVAQAASADPSFAGPITTAVDLGEVYASAQIAAPPHGYTVLKVAEMLGSEHIAALPPDVKRKSVMVALDAAGVKVTDIVEDAVRRDRALDTFERVLQKHVDDARAEVAAENARLEDEINQRVAELRARIDENARRVTAEEQELLAWQTRKQQEEATIAEAVSYFVSENPITASALPAKDKGDADVR